MMSDAWKNIFSSLAWVGSFIIILYYFKPGYFEKTEGYDHEPFFPWKYTLGIYLSLWVITYLIYFFRSSPSHAEIKGLWTITPEGMGSEVLVGGKTTPTRGKAFLLDEGETADFLTETFTFSFFISIDNATIELVKGQELKGDQRPHQNLISIPGAFNVSIDPLHETMRLNFITYKSEPYEVIIPTIKARRWHQMTICVEGRTVDLYQDGLLLKSVALPNVISARPGKPMVYMNSNMYARLAFVQSWPKRLKEPEVSNNYVWHIDREGRPPIPTVEMGSFGSFLVFSVPNFCQDGSCMASANNPQSSAARSGRSTALTHVEYQYA